MELGKLVTKPQFSHLQRGANVATHQESHEAPKRHYQCKTSFDRQGVVFAVLRASTDHVICHSIEEIGLLEQEITPGVVYDGDLYFPEVVNVQSLSHAGRVQLGVFSEVWATWGPLKGETAQGATGAHPGHQEQFSSQDRVSREPATKAPEPRDLGAGSRTEGYPAAV
ncbi:hypothetical protein QTO34_013426 [Cnephaeus nilssonii]|uniref:Uncharacterized protein n=1 Tax=Cnephaeus nilssonii TaxID=3371016 RepID=A0AA40LUW3_CNENI|nr:hypothetical protein QTO34_013426 [Eptesicus nilssonii]